MEWPKYGKEVLIVGNPESQVGILSLFTQKEQILLYLNKNDFALLGQLYNPSHGISILLRNCLANKNIRYLIVCGKDLSGSGEALIKLSKEGVEEILDEEELKGYKIKGLDEERIIDKEIPLETINLFRENVKIIDQRQLLDFNELKNVIKDLEKLPKYGEPEFFPEVEIKMERFPTDHSVFKVKERFVGDAWLKILDTIMRFGVIKKSDYSEDQKEILNVVAVITEENPRNIKWEDYFTFSKKHLEEYIPRVTTAEKVEGVHYTYGSRLKSWRGIDQIESLVKKLKKSLYSRRAVAVTWDVEKDCENADCPCIDLVQCLVQDDQLFMTVYIRSNDMFEGWPENALALRTLQFQIAERVGVKPGSLTTISGSAHIYERNWGKAQELLEKYPIPVKMLGDERGNFVISVEDGKIKVEHQSPNGTILEKFEGKTAEEIGSFLVNKQKFSDQYHAFYLGRELEKAELALKTGLKYTQEKSLVLGGDKMALDDEVQKGKLIVLDGTDGSGKGTQTELLIERLRKEGKRVEKADFPQYGKNSAQFVEKYLRGEFGELKDIGAKQASMFYAIDRYDASFQIREWLNEGVIVVSNRYVSANKGHQLGKIHDNEEMNKFLDWVNDLEYGIYSLPKPDITLFLHMTPEIGQQLVDHKKEREYTQGKKRDIHEADVNHLRNAERAYLFCVENDETENWKRVICFDEDKPKTREAVHKEIYDIVKEVL